MFFTPPSSTSSKTIQLRLNFSTKKVPDQLKKKVIREAVELAANDNLDFF